MINQAQPATTINNSTWLKGVVQELRAFEARNVSERSIRRYQMNVPVALCTRSESGRIAHICQAWAQDLSEQEIGLLTLNKFIVDDQIFVNFEPASGKPRHIVIKITSCRKLFGQLFRLSGQFILDDQQSETNPPPAP